MRHTPSLATYAGRWPFRPRTELARLGPYTALIGVACGPGRRGYLASTSQPEPGETRLTSGKHRFGLESRALVDVRESSLASPRNLTGIGSSLQLKGKRDTLVMTTRPVVKKPRPNQTSAGFRTFTAGTV